jgi:pentatricopeptide repeat protein
MSKTSGAKTELSPKSSTSQHNHHVVSDDLDAILFPKTSIQLPFPQVKPPSPDNLPAALRPSDGYAIAERIAMISACLNSGDADRAETLFHRMARLNPSDMKSIVSTGMINAFVEAFLDSDRRPAGPDLEKALEWRRRVTEYNADLRPDATTFAILVKHAISNNDLALASKILWEMEHDGVPAESLLTNSRFAEPEERAPLEALLRSIGKDTLVSANSPESVAQKVLAMTSQEETSGRQRANNQSSVSASSGASVSTADSLMLSAMQESIKPASSSSSLQHTLSSSSTAVTDSKLQSPSTAASDELRGTDSVGVQILRRTLATLDRNPNLTILERQQILEEKALLAAVEEQEATREKLPLELKNVLHMPSQLMASWHKSLVPLIKREIAAIEEATVDADEHNYLPFLKLLSPEQLSKICITEFLRLPSKSETKLTTPGAKTTASLLTSIGKAIEREYNLQQMMKKKNKKLVS